MRRRLSIAEVRRLRVRAQRLSGTAAEDVASAVDQVVGIQAQSAASARLAVRARTDGTTATDVDAVCARRRSVVRTWAMRGTLHMLASADASWIVGLLGPITRRSDRRRRAQLGLTDAVCEKAITAIEKVLAMSDPLTRAELMERLVDERVRVQTTGQAPPHLLLYAATCGTICRGPDRDDEPTYVLMSQWLGAKARNRLPDRDDALAELAKRYLAGYGPATLDDFAAWSGLPRSDARHALEIAADDVERVDTEIGEMLIRTGISPGRVPAGGVRLLGGFDTLLLGYRERDVLLAPKHGRKVQAGGMIAPTVLVDGEVVGTWTASRSAKGRTIKVEPFANLPRGSRTAVQKEARDIGRFLGERTSLHIAPETGRR